MTSNKHHTTTNKNAEHKDVCNNVVIYIAVLGFVYLQRFTNSTVYHAAAQVDMAGSTFAAPIHEALSYGYEFVTERNIKVSYQAVGSGTGKRMLFEKKVDIATTDSLVTDKEYSNANYQVLLLPLYASSVVIPFNVPEYVGTVYFAHILV